jgi:hypothetical protein
VWIAGGSKSLFLVTLEGKVYACGEGTNGRLGLGSPCANISVPRQLSALAQYVVKKVSVHSGGKHAMALTVDGRVFSWGEGEDGKLGHCSRLLSDKPRVIEVSGRKKGLKGQWRGMVFSSVIRIHRIYVFLGLRILLSSSKNRKKNLDSNCFVTSFGL